MLIRAADGFAPEGIAAAVNQMYPQLSAHAAHGMVRDVEQGLDGITGTISVLLGIIWLLSVLILGIAFRMVVHERRREFAILRVAGAPRVLLVRTMLTEAGLIAAAGAALGILVGAAVVLPFAGLMKESLTRPYLLPDGGVILALALGTFAATVLSGMLSAAWTVRCVGSAELSAVLREDG